ncbi:MAG: SAM-dependent methyltransferase [Actinomycetota bacterium]|nr:SAM-dependent methyltransferase [Actinomycetota bacterium]
MLADKLRTQIRDGGAMPFEEYMAACLYDEEFGFFTTGPLRSAKEGDFLTSPEVSPWFGRMLARWVAKETQRSGADPFWIVEVGAGSGSLLRPLIEELQDYSPVNGRGDADRSDAGGPSYEFHAIEASPAAREALVELLGRDNVHTSLDDLPDRINGVIIANELLDNLPCALAIRSGDGWVERWVGATDDRFGFVTAPARLEVATWCDAYAGIVPEGGMVEVQLEATRWIRAALSHIDRGAVVTIDYGGTAEELEPRRTQGTLRTYRSHHLGPDPLLEPGATDVTVDVNFTAMMAAAESCGATAELHRQDDFLSLFGLREIVRDLRHRERDLARSGEAMERLIVRSEMTDAETLLHPRGLGDFRVMTARRL